MIRCSDTTLIMRDGLRLFVRQWQHPKPKGGCFLVHGLGEHSGRYQHLAEELRAKGFSVWTFDHRGHGRSEGRRSDCGAFQEFVEDLHEVARAANACAPELPKIAIGHSLGGLIALSFAAEHPDLLRGVAVSSPAIRLGYELPKVKVALAETLSRLLPTTAIPNGVNPRWLCRDPEVVAAYEKDPLVHRTITARCAVLLRAAMRESPSWAARIRIPLLILQAGDDKICDPRGSAEFAQGVNSQLATFRRYEGLYHELFNEPERDRVIQDLIDWMERILQN